MDTGELKAAALCVKKLAAELVADLYESWTVSPLSMLRCSLAARAYDRLGPIATEGSTTTLCPSNPITRSDSQEPIGIVTTSIALE